MKIKNILFIGIVTIVAFTFYLIGKYGQLPSQNIAKASESLNSSTANTENRLPTYFPNTETVRPDEMRITALGTGLPTPITRAQKSCAWMVELGNGDVFLFDLGTGSMENIFGLRPDFGKMDKVFLSHLHSDHFGDLDAYIVGSWLSGRYTPLHIYGGTGETPELGTKAAVDGIMKALRWETAIRKSLVFFMKLDFTMEISVQS